MSNQKQVANVETSKISYTSYLLAQSNENDFDYNFFVLC